MFRLGYYVLFCILTVFFRVDCQEYDFAAEIKRQCLVPDPVGLLDCVENKVTLPYLTSWVDCTNSLGQNVKTSADIINYRCKSVWEGKAVIPEVIYIKDCVIEKTGLPAKNVSAEVLGAYKECESGEPKIQQQSIKTAPIQQQQLRTSTVEYNRPRQPFQTPSALPQSVQAQAPRPFQPQITASRQFQAPAPLLVQQQLPIIKQQFQAPPPRPVQPQVVAQQVPIRNTLPIQQIPVVQQFQVPPSIQPQYQQVAIRTPVQQVQARPQQLNQQQVPVAFNPQYPSSTSGAQYQNANARLQSGIPPSTNPANRQPFSQQYFIIYPRAPLPNQQQNINQPFLSQKTAVNPAYISQQQVSASVNQVSIANPVPNVPYSYSFQINHPQRPVL